jgi:hypothetical protein
MTSKSTLPGTALRHTNHSQLLAAGILFYLVSCGAQPTASPKLFPTLAPPDGCQSYDACAYILHYPPALELHALPSEDVVLTSPQDDALRIAFSARELEEEAQISLTTLLEALIEQVDAISEGVHWRLFAVIHTEIYFWDTVPTTVAYTMHAQVSEESWEGWRSSLDSIVATFMPINCGPY